MNKYNKYIEPTVEMLLQMLEEAYKDEYKFDIFLYKVSEEVIKNYEKELKKLLKKGIDLNKRIDIYDNPNLYSLVKELENKEWEHIISCAWFAMMVYEDSLTRTFKDTFIQTQILFAPSISTLPSSLGKEYFDTKVQITDTYITSHYLKIPWCQDGKIYSDRLYGHVANFQSKLNYVLEQGITQGKGMDWMIEAWRKLTGSTASAAARLLKTETVAMWSQATKEAYLDMGIEYIEIVGDAECGGVCLDYVGDVVPLREAELGAELPPYHPNCACSYIAFEETKEGNIEQEDIEED